MDTGLFDFENPNDDAGTDFDNVYQITVAYQDSANKVYTETVNITVTDNATEDMGSIRLDQEEQTTGRSSISLSMDDTTPAVLDFHSALDRDMLSQGAKDFIAQHGGLMPLTKYLASLQSLQDMTGAVATGVSAINSTNVVGIDVTGSNTQALIYSAPLVVLLLMAFVLQQEIIQATERLC